MSISASRAHQVLSGAEAEAVAKTHYPDICSLDRGALIEVARVLRDYRDKARDTLRRQRRSLRGKGNTRAGARGEEQHGGLAAKNQALTQALRRVNAEIKRFEQAGRRSRQPGHAARALELKRANPKRGYPSPGRTAHHGMHPTPSDRAPSPSEP